MSEQSRVLVNAAKCIQHEVWDFSLNDLRVCESVPQLDFAAFQFGGADNSLADISSCVCVRFVECTCCK